MGINLSKGGNINLTKEAPGLTALTIGLGWDANTFTTGGDFDLDASASLLGENGKLVAETGFVFYNNTADPTNAVKHSGDNRTGSGEGDDESIEIDLSKVAASVGVIRFAVTIHDAAIRRQNFGSVRNAYIRIVNPTTQAEVARYDLTEDFSTETCVVPGELYRHGADWKFRAVGSGFAGGLEAFVNSIQ